MSKHTMDRVRIFIADDKELIRNGLRMQLETVPDFEIVGTASHGKELIEALSQQEVDIVLMDIAMPVMDGLEATKQLKDKFPEVKVIMLTDYDEVPLVKKARKIAAEGYLLKNVSKEELLTAIEAVQSGKDYYGTAVGDTLPSLPIPNISEREKEILDLLAKGMSSLEIAQQLFISKNTVDTHRKNLLSKSGCKNVAELIRWGMNNGLL